MCAKDEIISLFFTQCNTQKETALWPTFVVVHTQGTLNPLIGTERRMRCAAATTST